MVLKGHIENGNIVVNGSPTLPEGAEVDIIVRPTEPEAVADKPSLRDVLLEFSGCASGLPPDASRNYKHYLYGTPKEEDQGE